MLTIDDVLIPESPPRLSGRVLATDLCGRLLGDLSLAQLITAAQGSLTGTMNTIEETPAHGDADTFF